MERNKRGISLIVLVITIIVMIILAGAVIISLSNSGIIGKANEAVESANMQQIQEIAALAWAEAYIDRISDSSVDLEARVIAALEQNKIDTTKYVIDVDNSGATIKVKSTLGDLIKSAADYGKTVDYNAGDISEWQVFYEDKENDYVFLIGKDEKAISLYKDGINNGYNENIEEIISIFRLGNKGYELDENRGNGNYAALSMLRAGGYNMDSQYVVASIAGPTIELLAAAYNEKHNTTAITPIVDITYTDTNPDDTLYYEARGANGYFVNSKGQTRITGLVTDDLYMPNYTYYIASPSACYSDMGGCDIMLAGMGKIESDIDGGDYYIRPVVCLKSDIPATTGDATDFSLIK